MTKQHFAPDRLIWKNFHSPLGELYLGASTSDEPALSYLLFARNSPHPKIDQRPHETLDACIAQLDAYFAGKLTTFDLPLRPHGTVFQRTCWNELQRIPYGETISYSEEARRLGDRKKMRAVGRANGANPIPIIIPCHRVIAADGSLHGYSGGVDVKRKLLDLESDNIRN